MKWLYLPFTTGTQHIGSILYATTIFAVKQKRWGVGTQIRFLDEFSYKIIICDGMCTSHGKWKKKRKEKKMLASHVANNLQPFCDIVGGCYCAFVENFISLSVITQYARNVAYTIHTILILM